jgi:hypothetical protein
MMMLVAVGAGALGLGACAQKKETMSAPPPANTGYSK